MVKACYLYFYLVTLSFILSPSVLGMTYHRLPVTSQGWG